MARLVSDDEGQASALAELDRLLELDPRPDSPDADESQRMAPVIKICEQRRWPIPLPDPVDAILFWRLCPRETTAGRSDRPSWFRCRTSASASAGSQPLRLSSGRSRQTK